MEDSFQMIKKKLTETPAPAYFDTVEYASRSLTPAERNWAQIEF